MYGICVFQSGLDRPYDHFGDKIRGYADFLKSSTLSPFDMVVMVDAYDVLLFSEVRNVVSYMQSATHAPIVTCAEAGIYPEYASKSRQFA